MDFSFCELKKAKKNTDLLFFAKLQKAQNIEFNVLQVLKTRKQIDFNF